jgi:ribonuclease BN (tRNA processing enzyme)
MMHPVRGVPRSDVPPIDLCSRVDSRTRESKQAAVLSGPPDELIPDSRLTRRQARTIADHHTDAAEAGHVFQRVQPKLAVFSHHPNIVPAEVLRVATQNYSGRVEFGEDMMTIDIGSAINIRRFSAASK